MGMIKTSSRFPPKNTVEFVKGTCYMNKLTVFDDSDVDGCFRSDRPHCCEILVVRKSEETMMFVLMRGIRGTRV